MTVEKILLGFDPVEKNILPALKEINKKFGYIGKEEAEQAAGYFGVSLTRIYEVASFFDQLATKKTAPLVVRVCNSGPCTVKNAMSIVREVENYLRVKADDESNPKIKLETVSCLGLCGEGPVMEVNGTPYTNLTREKIDDILKQYL